MPTLAYYEADVRRVLKDPFGNFYTTADINYWTNKARKQVAKEGQCVRYLVPGSGSLDSLTIGAGGSGYTTVAVEITGPDAVGTGFVQATAMATLNAGVVTAINITNPGTGYVATPTVTVVGDGSGAVITAALTSRLLGITGVEKYLYADATAILQSRVPGVGGVQGILSVAVAWGSMKPVLDHYDFTFMQAYARSYPAYQSWPTMFSNYGQGESGSIYIYPPPSQTMEMEWDCACSVQDLAPSQLIDLIPEPWFDAVVYYACSYAYESAQRPQDCDRMRSRYREKMLEARVAMSPSMIPTMYPAGP